MRFEQAPAVLKWRVLDVKTGVSTEIATFAPTEDMVYLLTFFDQFARSHSVWSPDGRYLVYGATDDTGTDNVMVASTTGARKPVKVSGGTIGIWSWK